MLKALNALKSRLNSRLVVGLLGVTLGFIFPNLAPLVQPLADSFISQSYTDNQVNLSLSPRASFGCLNPRIDYER